MTVTYKEINILIVLKHVEGFNFTFHSSLSLEILFLYNLIYSFNNKAVIRIEADF